MRAPNLRYEEVEALLKRVLGGHPHRVVDILQSSDSFDAALSAIAAEFNLSVAEAEIVLDQQFKLLIQMKP